MSSVAQFGAVAAAKPAFVVTPVRKTIKKSFARFNKEEHKSEVEERDVTVDGWNVRFLRGHEIFIDSEAELRRLGFTGPVPIIGKTQGSEEEEVIAVMPSTLPDTKGV